MWKSTKIRQILVITDGQSNVGSDPIQAARRAGGAGITVNVIGILNEGALGAQGEREVQQIATAGGGMARIVEIRDLSGTVQMMTQKSMQMTIHQVVNRELQSIMGETEESLPPMKRAQVAQMVDQIGEEATLQLAVVVDVSASMHSKLPKVREALRDLEIGLEARTGYHEVAILTFPGGNGQSTKTLCDFTQHPDLTNLMNELTAGGGTPTGPAIEAALELMQAKKQAPNLALPEQWETDGDMGSYVV
jgi:Ca-activated chloride channel homolog